MVTEKKTVTERTVEYECEGVRLVGTLCVPSDLGGSTVPGVLVSHAWDGCTDNMRTHAKTLAENGYAAFALDMYGDGKIGNSTAECLALMTPVKSDRRLLIARITTALETLKAQAEVDSARTAAIGFCFGGLCVLDLARSGAEVCGVVSLHGLFDAPSSDLCVSPIKAKVLALHGYKDPMVKPEDVLGLMKELSAAECDFQVHAYGTALHAFTAVDANMPEMGIVYEKNAHMRAMRSMNDFLGDVFETK